MCEYEADTNAENYLKKTPLKIACRDSNEATIHLLLDNGAFRRPSALELIEDIGVVQNVEARLKRDEDEAKAEAAASKLRFEKGGGGEVAVKTAYGQWIPYIDKSRRHKPDDNLFYYNLVKGRG